MPGASITVELLKNLKLSPPPSKHTLYFDREITGFILEHRSSGGMSYYFRYPLGDGKMRMVRLGKERDLTLSDARGQAYIMRREFLSGNEPALASSKLASAPLLKDFLLDRYIPSIKPRRRSWHLDEATMRHHFVPRFGARRMDSISHVEMEAHLADLINQGYKAISVNR